MLGPKPGHCSLHTYIYLLVSYLYCYRRFHNDVMYAVKGTEVKSRSWAACISSQSFYATDRRPEPAHEKSSHPLRPLSVPSSVPGQLFKNERDEQTVGIFIGCILIGRILICCRSNLMVVGWRYWHPPPIGA